jgi:archaellum biogenesis protein FlaJ (TadC family)
MEFTDKADILGELWTNYKNDKEFAEFIEYNDLGLPLAFFISDGLVKEVSDEAIMYVEETFELFIRALEIQEEELQNGMTLADILEMVSKRDNK